MFLIVVGIFAGSTGAYALLFQARPSRFLALMAVALVLSVSGYWIRTRSGDLDVVAIAPDAIALHFELPKALGLGAHAHPVVTALAGAAAGAAVVFVVALAGFITRGSLLPAMGLFAVYGAVLGLVKRRTLQRGGLVKSRSGTYYATYRRLSQAVVPVIVVAWLVVSAPDANPVPLMLIAGCLLFWVGKAFHSVWDATHTALLALYYGENSPRTVEWGLYEWLRRSRRDLELTSVTYHPERAEATVVGRFQRPDELQRDMSRLDFLKRVTLIADEEYRAS